MCVFALQNQRETLALDFVLIPFFFHHSNIFSVAVQIALDFLMRCFSAAAAAASPGGLRCRDAAFITGNDGSEIEQKEGEKIVVKGVREGRS